MEPNWSLDCRLETEDVKSDVGQTHPFTMADPNSGSPSESLGQFQEVKEHIHGQRARNSEGKILLLLAQPRLSSPGLKCNLLGNSLLSQLRTDELPNARDEHAQSSIHQMLIKRILHTRPGTTLLKKRVMDHWTKPGLVEDQTSILGWNCRNGRVVSKHSSIHRPSDKGIVFQEPELGS